MKKLSTTNHHHHHSHHNSISSTITITNSADKLYPLHRSVTDDNSTNNQSKVSSSPITRFVCKLLGLAGPSAHRPRIWHKSTSTTSITKSSVISSYQKPINTDSGTAPVRKPTTITIITPQIPCKLSSPDMNWDHDNNNVYMNQITDHDDSISIASSSVSTSSSTSSTIDNPSNNSAAVDALVIASLIPTKPKPIDLDSLPSVTLSGRRPDSEAVMTGTIAELIRPYLPRRYRITPKWNLCYSLDQHGASLHTLYSLMMDYEGPCMMIIKDADGQIFGSYLSNALSSQSHYYGTGECFLWKLSSLCPKKDVPKIKVYPWTGENDYMILSDSSFIAIGGGNGKFGLWLNADLERGHSNTCPTFDNEILSLQPKFECVEMEIWGFSL